MKPLVETTPNLHLASLSYDKETDEWLFNFGSTNILRTVSPWRIRRNEVVLISSTDQGHKHGFTEPVDLVVKVKSILISPIVSIMVNDVADLHIKFQTEEELEVFNLSGHENWDFSFVDETHFIGQGGGRVIKL